MYNTWKLGFGKKKKKHGNDLKVEDDDDDDDDDDDETKPGELWKKNIKIIEELPAGESEELPASLEDDFETMV